MLSIELNAPIQLRCFDFSADAVFDGRHCRILRGASDDALNAVDSATREVPSLRRGCVIASVSLAAGGSLSGARSAPQCSRFLVRSLIMASITEIAASFPWPVRGEGAGGLQRLLHTKAPAEPLVDVNSLQHYCNCFISICDA
jgi:hypothetical protein